MTASMLPLERLRRNVVSIEWDGTSGSGFVLRRSGGVVFVVTNYHLLPDDPAQDFKLILSLADGAEVVGKNVEIIWCDKMTDFVIAVAEVPSRPGMPRGLAGRQFIAPRIGDEVYSIGNPSHLRQVVSRGIVGGMAHDGDAPQLLVDMHVHPGNSGGPLLDRHGRLVGVISAGFAEGFEGLNIAIPYDYLLERIGPWSEYASSDPAWRPLPHTYTAVHELPRRRQPDPQLVSLILGHVQVACGLDLHRRYRLTRFERQSTRAPALERLAVVFERLDGQDHVEVQVVGGRYRRIEHRRGGWSAGSAATRGRSRGARAASPRRGESA